MTGRWVATRYSAGQAAGAFLRLTLVRPVWWLFVTGIELALALLIGLSFDDRYGVTVRVLWGTVYALVPTLGIVVVALGLSYLLNRRRFRQRLREGVVLEAGIGAHFLVLRSPWAQTTLSFDGLASVRTQGQWVFLQQIGSPVLSVWPAELFPPAELAQLKRSVQPHKS
jgi:ABC-type sugar transport system permease subunit